MDRQIDRTSLGGRTDGQTNRLFFNVDEQTDRETAGQTELRNYYIDYNTLVTNLEKAYKIYWHYVFILMRGYLCTLI